MKNQLKQLSPVLEGFKVRIDDKGRVLSKPDIKTMNEYKSGGGNVLRDEINAYNQAKEVIRMPKATGFIRDAWKITENEEDAGTFNTEQLRGIHIYSAICEYPPQIGHYIPCDEEGKPLEEPPQWCESWEFKKKQEVSRANEAYRLATNRVIFEGWEVVAIGDNYTIITNSEYFIEFTSNGNCQLVNTLRIPIAVFTSYEDAFIVVDHYVDLTKLK